MENLVMQSSLNIFYRDKKIFISGHTGFKGSWLANWLEHAGAHVCGYSLPPNTQPSHFELLNLSVKNHFADINNDASLKHAVKDFQPQIVFHLAAQPLVRYSYEHPVETFETNVLGTLKVLEACRSCNSVKAVVCVTSDKVYKNDHAGKSFKEDDALGGSDPYSASKSCADWLATAYRFSYLEKNSTPSFAMATARAGNVIGGGDWANDRLIPDLVRAASRNERAVIRHAAFIRPWQHVLESISAYLVLGKMLFEQPSVASGSWNFGPADNENYAVKKIVELCCGHWKKIDPDFREAENDFSESSALSINSDKAKLQLLWQPVWDAKTAVEKTIGWYKNFYESGDVLTQQQLDEYFVSAKQKQIQWAQ